MATPTLKVPKQIREVIQHMHPHLKKDMRAALTLILAKPNCGKPLEQELEGYWSLRVRKHRIIYRPDSEGAEIVAIGPRRTIYEEVARQLLHSHGKQNKST
jgi:mRNA interferase RelE/StbE